MISHLHAEHPEQYRIEGCHIRLCEYVQKYCKMSISH